MKQFLLIVSIIYSFMFINACDNLEVITLDEVNVKVQDYFEDGQTNLSNLSFNYMEDNVIVIGLIDNSEEKQQELLDEIFTSKENKYIKKENLIKFIQGEQNLNLPHYSFDVEEYINNIIMNGPNNSSNPYDYINKSKENYNELINNPKQTFEYAIKDLISNNGNEGLKSYIEAILCSEINKSFEYNFSSAEDFLNNYKLFLTKSYTDFNSYDKYALSLLK